MLTSVELAGLDAVTIAKGVADRTLSPVEIAEAALSAIETINPALHAFSTVIAEDVLISAAILEKKVLNGEPVGPLAGVPIPIKDLVLTKGMRTTFGSRLYEDFVPDEDDIAIARLRASDALILGKTNASEFGYGGFGHNPLFPTTLNPWNPALTPGGSSAGSAVAVATGISPIAIGSDGGGSIRIPASFNGLFGMKASMGRVALWPSCRDTSLPGVSSWESIEHLGPISRTVADAALMLSVIAGPDPRDRHSIPCDDIEWMEAITLTALPPLRVAYCPDWGGLPLDPEVRSICDAAAARFERDLGYQVDITLPPFGWEIEAFRSIVAMDTDIAGIRRLIKTTGKQVSKGLQALLDRQWTGEEFIEAGIRRRAATASMAAFMTDYDILLTPTVSCLPFSIDRDGPGVIDGRLVDDDSWSPAAFPSNLTGQPAASVPAGWTKSGLPVGLQIIGRHLADATVLKASADFERIQPWAARRPTGYLSNTGR